MYQEFNKRNIFRIELIMIGKFQNDQKDRNIL